MSITRQPRPYPSLNQVPPPPTLNDDPPTVNHTRGATRSVSVPHDLARPVSRLFSPMSSRQNNLRSSAMSDRVHHTRSDSRITQAREWTVFGQLLHDTHPSRSTGVEEYESGSGTGTTRRGHGNGYRYGSQPRSQAVRDDVDVEDDESIASQFYYTASPPKNTDQIPLLDDSMPTENHTGGQSSTSTLNGNANHNGDNISIRSSKLSKRRSSSISLRTRMISSIPTLTALQRNILKCAFAYFLGSLFTFWPVLSDFLQAVVPLEAGQGPSSSGHMVATIVVYYNPAKTIGGMMEADKYCLLGAVYSSIVCLVSMGLFWLLEDQPGLEFWADTSVFITVGIAMTLVAWAKLSMERPSFNAACSMTAIMIFITVVKEGGAETLIHVLFIVVLGTIISNVVCFSIWPQSAATNLQNNMSTVLDSFSTLLRMTTQTFLLEDSPSNIRLTREQLVRATQEHQSSFTSLKKNLIEARSEWLDKRMRAPSSKSQYGDDVDLYDAVVSGLTRLAQHLNGLRDGARQQKDLLLKSGDGVGDGKRGRKSENSDDAAAALNGKGGTGVGGGRGETRAAELLTGLVEDMASPMSALSNACTDCLNTLSDAFTEDNFPDNTDSSPSARIDYASLTANIRRALFTFERTSSHAVLRFFRKVNEEGKVLDEATKRGDHLGSAEDSDGIFLVYFYTFTLQEFARELINVTDVIGAMSYVQATDSVGTTERLFGWIGWPFVRAKRAAPSDEETVPPVAGPSTSQTRPSEGRRKSLTRKISNMVLPSRKVKETFPSIQPHAPNTAQTPNAELLSLPGRIKQTMWRLGARMRETDMLYSIKCGLATSILAGPAFVESTRPLFMEYRGEWALITCFVVLSPTVGQTNFLSVHRILGTLLGAYTAVGIYSMFPHNPYVLSIFGALFSMPCFYYIVSKPQYSTSGRFVLLAYNLTALFCYNSRYAGTVDILTVAKHRVVAVTVGVVWAFAVSRWWWPIEARRELSKGLSEFVLSLGWLYTRLVQTNSVSPERLDLIYSAKEPEARRKKETTEAHLTNSIRQFMSMELHLQLQIIKLQGLLAQTAHEPRLKGPFPVHIYRTILTSLQVILDKLHLMRCVTTKEEWFTTVRKDFIIPVNSQRREMVGNVLLYFSTLSSAFTLKRALPPYLPPAEDARQRLVEAIRQLEVVKNRDVKQSEHLLFFAYALMMKGVIQELDFLGVTLQDAFGVIGQSVESFEHFFAPEP
ncbi:hypothetical protein FRB95_008443 [Tulasnella sp. JGI-2019a]|nr:hypothetical protein FRB95_008443 [Tulasnella sp. JGI-2019a]